MAVAELAVSSSDAEKKSYSHAEVAAGALPPNGQYADQDEVFSYEEQRRIIGRM
jgi:hypothetical protein